MIPLCQATAHATGPAISMGRGEFAAALSSTRALMVVLGPTLWGRTYTLRAAALRPATQLGLGRCGGSRCLPASSDPSLRLQSGFHGYA
jgi:hypothetical protein